MGGRKRGRGGVRASTAESFSQDEARFQTAPFFMVYIIYCAVEVSLEHAPDNREQWPRSSMSWADTCDVQASTIRRPVHHIEDSEGVAVPRSATDSTEVDKNVSSL